METRQQIERLMLQDLECKREVYNRAKELQQIAQDTRISNASPEYASALNGVLVSLREFNEFILNGVIPDRLSHLGPQVNQPMAGLRVESSRQ